MFCKQSREQRRQVGTFKKLNQASFYTKKVMNNSEPDLVGKKHNWAFTKRHLITINYMVITLAVTATWNSFPVILSKNLLNALTSNESIMN